MEKKGNCKHGHRSTIGKAAWCDLNEDGFFLKLHDLCPNSKCKCQKQVECTPRQFQLEGTAFKNTMKNTFKGTENLWKSFNKTGLK